MPRPRTPPDQYERQHERREGNQNVAAAAVHGREGQFLHRPVLPDRVEGQVKRLPHKIGPGDEAEIEAQHRQPEARASRKRSVRGEVDIRLPQRSEQIETESGRGRWGPYMTIYVY